VSVKLCFLVKVRKARGLKVAGGSNTGRILGFDRGAMWKGRIGCTGVAKAGEDEGIELRGAGVGGGLNIGIAREFPGPGKLMIQITLAVELSGV
jgi:hypothetical protein